MDEHDKIENQELNLPEVTVDDLVKEESADISASDIAELEADFNNNPLGEIKWRHPQKVLTNREALILLSKKEEDLTESEKTALKWLILRTKHHHSTPKKILTKAQNKRKRLKRRMAKKSRKANR